MLETLKWRIFEDFQESPFLTFIARTKVLVLNVFCLLNLLLMDVGLSAMVFASNTIPTTFGQVAAALAGAGALLFVAVGFVPNASWKQKS